MAEVGEPRQARRAADSGWLCQVALRASQLWDFIDRRQIDAHVLTVFIAWGTFKLTTWSLHFAELSTREGSDVALIIGAVMGPWALLQGAAVKFYFDARR